MMRVFQNQCQYQNSVKVVEGKLILSFPGAVTPVVWQMDLNEVKVSALEVNDNKDGKKDNFVLILKKPKGETIEVAIFEKKEEAVSALMAASRALEKAHGQITQSVEKSRKTSAETAQQTIIMPSRQKSGILKTILWVFGGIIIIIVMVNLLNAMSLRAPGGKQNVNYKAQFTSGSAANTTGVPVSADDFLEGR